MKKLILTAIFVVAVAFVANQVPAVAVETSGASTVQAAGSDQPKPAKAEKAKKAKKAKKVSH